MVGSPRGFKTPPDLQVAPNIYEIGVPRDAHVSKFKKPRR